MSMSIDKIDLIKERTNLNYSEAQEVLQKFDGDVVEALIYLESNKQTVNNSTYNQNTTESEYKYSSHQYKRHQHRGVLKDFFKKMHATRLLVKKDNRNLINLPLTISLPLILFTLPFSIIIFVVGAMTGHKISVIKPSGENLSINEVVEVVKE